MVNQRMLEAFIQVDSEIESLPKNAALTDAEFDAIVRPEDMIAPK